MLKKMMLLAVAATSLVAFAMPAVANAQELTDSEGTVPVGADVTATSTNLVVTTALGDQTCTRVTIHAEVTANGPTTAALQSTAVTTEGCDLKTTSSGTLDPITITRATIALHLTEGGVGTSSMTLVKDLGNPIFAVCHEEGTPGITYVANSDSLHLEGALGGPCGTLTMHGDFTLETANEDPVFVG